MTNNPKRIRGHDKLRITWEPGYKGNGDKRIYVEDCVLTIRDMLRLNQLLAENERNINKDKIERTGHFFYKEAVNDAIDGVELDDICTKYKIPFI